MRVAFSASPLYLQRLRHLFKTLAVRFPDHERVPGVGFTKAQRAAYRVRSECWTRGWRGLLSAVEHFVPLSPWDARVYEKRSLDAERKILSLSKRPDLIFHLFGMYAPFWRCDSIPYVLALDFTEALARREWAPWAPFLNEKAWEAWWECERCAYRSLIRPGLVAVDADRSFPFRNHFYAARAGRDRQPTAARKIRT